MICSGRMEPQHRDILRVLSDIVVPLLRAEGGKLYLVSIEQDRLVVHLSGRLGGAPGVRIFGRKILEPAIHSVAPRAQVILTAGYLIPPGAAEIT